MLTVNYICENSREVIDKLKIKNFDAEEIVQAIVELNSQRKLLQTSVNNKQAEINTVSKNIGLLIQSGNQEEADLAKTKTTQLKEEIKQIDNELSAIQTQLKKKTIELPNIPHSSVPAGQGAEDNTIEKEGGQKPRFSIDKPLPHWELASKYNIIDFELGNKITGSGFPVYVDKGARLHRALIQFFLAENTKAGYTEVMPPLMVNEDSAFGTGQLPDKEGQMYVITEDNFYLIPTAEVPVTNIYRNVILQEVDLPVKLTSYTPCFRREAGSYGKDVRGLNRLHQFDKVEIVQIQHPDKSYLALEEMVNLVEQLLIKLELPYRVVKLCGGDMSFHSALTYDFEVFSAAQDRWLEVSSVSNFESFQANRLMLRYKDKTQKKTFLAHTLNGSALALPRIVAALLENNQTSDGIHIPEVLHHFTGFGKIN